MISLHDIIFSYIIEKLLYITTPPIITTTTIMIPPITPIIVHLVLDSLSFKILSDPYA